MRQTIGDVVRNLRVGKGLTQEELCDGICSASTLSRIENGTQYPTRLIFTLLAEKMGVDRYIYEDYVGDYDYEIYELTVRILACLEKGETEKAETYLDSLRYLTDEGAELESKAECIYRFVELLSASIDYNKTRRNEEDTESIELHQYGYYLYEEMNRLLETCEGLDFKRGSAVIDKMEIRMYNLMGYAKYIQGDYKNAIDIWISLIDNYRKRSFEGADFPKEMAALYCNTGAALTSLGMYEEAEAFLERGLRLCFDGGGLRLVNRILHNRMYCFRLKGDKNRAYINLAFSKAICTCLKNDILKEEKILRIPNTPYIIQIF